MLIGSHYFIYYLLTLMSDPNYPKLVL